MTGEKILTVVDNYLKFLSELGYKPKAYPHESIVITNKQKLNHAMHMLEQIKKFIEENRRDKAFRWLGFVQSILWTEGLYKLEDLKNHNMPD